MRILHGSLLSGVASLVAITVLPGAAAAATTCRPTILRAMEAAR
jgi:hypothetical protein